MLAYNLKRVMQILGIGPMLRLLTAGAVCASQSTAPAHSAATTTVYDLAHPRIARISHSDNRSTPKPFSARLQPVELALFTQPRPRAATRRRLPIVRNAVIRLETRPELPEARRAQLLRSAAVPMTYALAPGRTAALERPSQLTTTPVSVDPARPPHPAIFMILYLPSAIAFGYVTVTLVYLLSHAGVSVSEIAGLVALLFFPQTWKVLWAPIVDTTLTSKRWYVISAAATGLLTLGTAYVPAKEGSLWLLDVLVLALSIASCASSMATESLMAHTTAPDQQGRAGGWLQAGNLGGGGLGGGAGLWLGQHVAAWSAGVVLGLACVACCATLLLVTQPSRARGVLSYRAEIIVVGRDVWGVVRSRAGFLALLLFVLPIGTGSASNLWAAVADDWRASADTVALVNGVLGGLIAMVGCFVGGYLCDVIDRTTGYVLFGIALAVCAVAMAIGPRTSAMFVILTCVYFFFTGCIYAAFTGVVLETIGTGAAATKYNLMSSIGNIPIAYVTLIDGWAQTRLGSGGMLYTEAALGIVGVIVFIGIALATRSRAVAADDRSPRIA